MPVAAPSSSYVDALRFGSTLVDVRFTVYQKGYPVGAPYIGFLSTGSITVDRNSEQRRTGQLTVVVDPVIPPPPLVPTSPTAILAPFGNEVYVEYGIAATGNLSAIQWIPLGLYAIATTTADDQSTNLVVTLDLYDRSWTISQRALTTPYNFPATASGNLAAEIEALVTLVWNQQFGVAPLNFAIVPTDLTVPIASYNQGSDPWQACLDMASACGYELYFDVNGTVVGRPIPNPLTQPVSWNFTDDETAILGYGGTGGSTALFGSPYSSPIDCQVTMTRDGIYNDIIIQGTGDANAATYSGSGLQTAPPPALAEALDTNPLSATWVGGGMGDVPNFNSTSLVTSAGALAMAENELSVALSSAWEVTLSVPPNPILDIDDVVTITRPRIGLTNVKVVIDTITHAISYADRTMITGRVIPGVYVPSS